MRRRLGLLAFVCSVAAWSGAAERPKIEISVARAEWHLAQLPKDDPWLRAPDASTLAWGESHLLHALVDLYEATGDAKYLAEVARRGDRLLAHRDDRRGVADGSGKVRPAWSMASKYVVAEGSILDAAGQTVATLRSTPTAYNNLTKVEVQPDPAGRPGRFSLRISNTRFKRDETWTDLSLDPADARDAERLVNAPVQTHVAKAGSGRETPSLLLRLTRAGIPPGPMATQSFSLRPIPLAYLGYLGVIYHPLLRLAEQVRAKSDLAELRPAADRFVAAAKESYADADRRLWREGPGAGEGYYLTCERGESFPYDNVGQPFNFLGRHAAAQFALARLTGDTAYRERAAKLVRLFQRRLKYESADDLYVWNYWYEPVTTTGWTAPDGPSRNVPNFPRAAVVEDISHGVLDLALVLAAADAGVEFTAADVRRFARTLRLRVLNPERTGVRRRVDGTGGDYPDYLPALAGWVDLAGADPEVYREIRRTVEAAGPDRLPLLAALLKWERRLGAAGAAPR